MTAALVMLATAVDATAAPVAVTAVNWPAVIGAVAASLLINAVTWLIAARVTTAVLREKNQHLAVLVQTLTTNLAAVTDAVANLRNDVANVRRERTECELKAARSFATREDFVQVVADAAGGLRSINTKLDTVAAAGRGSVSKAHGRVDELADRVTRIETTQDNSGVRHAG